MAQARGARQPGRALGAAGLLASSVATAWFKARRSAQPAGPAVAVAVRESFERLGPAYVKLGQLISVRPDLFDPDLVFELSKLQDSVDPAPYSAISRVIDAEFGRGPDELFASFDREPLAAGSVAQVHRAVLDDGRAAVVKVQRPEARALMSLDLAMAARLARWGARLGLLRGVDAVALVDEFAASAARELDFRVEAAHADRFAFLFSHDPEIHIPWVEWRRTSGRVLTMEHVDGWTLARIDEARSAGVDSGALARAGARAFMQQVLVDGFFHADLHPANLMLMGDSRIAYLDFGIVGRLSARERRAVGRLLGAFTAKDAQRAIEVSGQLGVEVPEERRAAAVRELDQLLEEFLGDSGSLKLAAFGRRFLVLLRRNNIIVPPGYGLLVKALVTVEGVSQTLAPDINLVEVARPVAAALAIRESLGSTLAGALAWKALEKARPAARGRAVSRAMPDDPIT